MTKASDLIEEQAAQWLIRIESDGSPEKWAALDAWLGQDPRHRAAFLRLSVSWRKAEQLRGLRGFDGGVDVDLLSPRALRARRSASRAPIRQPQWGFAAAAAALVVIALAVSWWLTTPRFDTQVYATEIGGIEHIQLADGSAIDLNTDSELHVRFTDDRREIALLRGEAAFKVAHDAERPFDVRAGKITVRAVGTEFSVRLRESMQVDVRVTEGRVAINPPSNEVLTPGDTARIASGGAAIKTVPTELLIRKLAWKKGRLYFEGETLIEAVGEFNRYNRRQLVVVDPKIVDAQISGTFQATDPDSFAAALEAQFGIRARSVGRSDGSGVIRLDGKDP